MRCRDWAGAIAVMASLGCGAAAQPRVDAPPDALAEGEALFARSDYVGAARAYEAHLIDRPDDPRNDLVLLRLGMIYLVHGSPDRDAKRGEDSLGELSSRFPLSPLRDEAEYILALRREVAELKAESEGRQIEVRRLESQIEALKRIDLERGDSPR